MDIYYVVVQQNVGISLFLNVVEKRWYIHKFKKIIKIKILKNNTFLIN